MTVAFIIVTHDSRGAIAGTLPALAEQLQAGDELIVVDNASTDGTPAAVRELAPAAHVIEAGANLGYGEGNNRGAAAASAELLCFLNPDAVPAPGFREAIARPLDGTRGWDAWQGLVTADGGRVVNTRGGIVHFTGIAWAGGAGEELGVERAAEPAFVSGACLAIGRERFLALGGFAREFFLYQEDVDLSLRLRLAGGRLGLEPEARVDHAYEFTKGPAKWRYLERNRWATLIRIYPGALLAVLAPGLAATELALIPISLAGGWFRQKVLAWGDTVPAIPRLVRERRAIQATRTVSADEFAGALTSKLDSRYLGPVARSRLLAAALGLYWRLARALLGGGRGR
jgi:N-acetylglucosaminyl-diphospho-decaprenol L-rhamnosyltransferase